MVFPFLLPVFVLAVAAVMFMLLIAAVIATAKRTPVIFTVLAALAGVGAAVGAFALRAALRRAQGWQRAQSSAARRGAAAATPESSTDSTAAAPALAAAAEPEPPRRAVRPEHAGQYADDARRLVVEIKDALKTSPLPPEQKAALLAQVRAAPESAARALNKIGRLRGLRDVARRSPPSEGVLATLREIDELEAQLMDELAHVRSTLLAISVSLVRVDVARGDRGLDRMVTELSQTNQRLSDLADGYGGLRAEQALG